MANTATIPSWNQEPQYGINPPKKPGEGSPIAYPGTTAPLKPDPGPSNNGTPLLTAIPQITNTARSDTVSADAAKTGPAELVENRVGGIIDANSPLMQLAAARANQAKNDRGLLSSSMAVGDAQKAVLDAATPIASQDSQAINQTNQFNTSNQQQTNLQNATQAQRTSELNAASENKSAETNLENAMRTNLANLDVSTRTFMAEMEQKNKQLIQSSANAATLFNTFQQQVSAIMTSPNITGDSNVPDPNNPDRMLTNKELAIRNLQSMLQDSLAAQDAISGLDLSSIIGIEPAPSGKDTPASSPSQPAQQFTVTETSSNDPNTPPTGSPGQNGPIPNQWKWNGSAWTAVPSWTADFGNG